MMAIMAEEIEPLKNQSGFFPNVIIQPYAVGAIAAGKVRGGNAYGIDVDGPLSGELQYPQPKATCPGTRRSFWNILSLTFGACTSDRNIQKLTKDILEVVLLTSVWDNAEDDASQYAFAERFVTRATQASVDAGKDHPWLYVNYAYTSQNPFASYGDENHARLKAIQKAVDPQGVFSSQGLSKGYFKLN